MAQIEDAFRLSELLCARLCDELGAVSSTLSGVLVLGEEQQRSGETLRLAGDAAADLGNRLRLFRAAWGPASGPLDTAQLRVLAEGLPGHGRIKLDLSGVPDDAVFAEGIGRVLLNLMLLAAESLPGGGTVAPSGSPGAAVTVTIAGRRAAWPAGFAAMLADESAAWSALAAPRALQAPLTALLARGLGLRLSLEKAPAGTRAPPAALLAPG